MHHQVAQRSIITVAGCERKPLLNWFLRFIEISVPFQRKILVLLFVIDDSQTESLELSELASKRHVVLMCFPSHITHRLQTRHVSLMAPLNQY
jgi:hypothetical protein